MLPTIHMFWHGSPLSELERLSLASFAHHGHKVMLYSYSDLSRIPAGITLADAANIIPEKEVFRCKKRKSLGAFSDYFRAAVLHKNGGIYADTDVICLKPLKYDSEIILGYEDSSTINGAVMGVHAGSKLTEELLLSWENPDRILPFDTKKDKRRKFWRRLHPGNSRERLLWGELGPTGITNWINQLGWEDKILPFWHFYPIPYTHWRSIFDSSMSGNHSFLDNSSCIHIWNEMLRLNNIDKNQKFPPDSLIEMLRSRYLVA